MNGNIITIENGTVSVPATNEIWMTQHEIADLFECFISKVNVNVRSILKSGVLNETKVCRTHNYKNGNSVEQYNLEMIIALVFRIKSRNAEVFREWLMGKVVSQNIFQLRLTDDFQSNKLMLN